jgi:hypothetical protein
MVMSSAHPDVPQNSPPAPAAVRAAEKGGTRMKRAEFLDAFDLKVDP